MHFQTDILEYRIQAPRNFQVQILKVWNDGSRIGISSWLGILGSATASRFDQNIVLASQGDGSQGYDQKEVWNVGLDTFTMDQIALLGAGKVKNALGVELTKSTITVSSSKVTFPKKKQYLKVLQLLNLIQYVLFHAYRLSPSNQASHTIFDKVRFHFLISLLALPTLIAITWPMAFGWQAGAKVQGRR